MLLIVVWETVRDIVTSSSTDLEALHDDNFNEWHWTKDTTFRNTNNTAYQILLCIANGITMTMISTSLYSFYAVVVVNCLEFGKLDPGSLGYPKDLICQRYTNESQRSHLECALKCLRSECVVWTSDTSETTCVVCRQCDNSGDTLLANAADVNRSLPVIKQGKYMKCCTTYQKLLGIFKRGARASAETLMTKFGSHIWIGTGKVNVRFKNSAQPCHCHENRAYI